MEEVYIYLYTEQDIYLYTEHYIYLPRRMGTVSAAKSNG